MRLPLSLSLSLSLSVLSSPKQKHPTAIPPATIRKSKPLPPDQKTQSTNQATTTTIRKPNPPPPPPSENPIHHPPLENPSNHPPSTTINRNLASHHYKPHIKIKLINPTKSFFFSCKFYYFFILLYIGLQHTIKHKKKK